MLSFTLSFSQQEMLFQRTCLLVNYEDATRALEKAKPLKRQAVSELLLLYIQMACISLAINILIFQLCNRFNKICCLIGNDGDD